MIREKASLPEICNGKVESINIFTEVGCCVDDGFIWKCCLADL